MIAPPAAHGYDWQTVQAPEIELLWWEGCPSTEHALDALREVLGELGLASAPITLVEIRDDGQARARRFAGSPTIVIDGWDLVELAEGPGPVPEADEAPTGGVTEARGGPAAEQRDTAALSCRLYRRRDGRISPTPDPLDIREALVRASALRENAGIRA
jgi:hypothetical protein